MNRHTCFSSSGEEGSHKPRLKKYDATYSGPKALYVESTETGKDEKEGIEGEGEEDYID